MAFVRVLASSIAYATTSVFMNLSNKGLSFSHLTTPQLILYQTCFTVAMVWASMYLGWIRYKQLKFKLLKRWLVATLLFLVVLFSGQASISRLPVPIVTVLKNMTVILTAIGDYIFFGQAVSREIALVLLLMLMTVVGACAGLTAFDGTGFTWMIINIAAAAMYTLYVRYAMKKATISDFTLVYYNNLITGLLLFPIVLWSGTENLGALYYIPLDVNAVTLLILNGMCGFALSLSTFWLLRTTSPTTLSMVGALSKLPMTIVGAFLFPTSFTSLTHASIISSLACGVLYAYAKQLQSKKLLPGSKLIILGDPDSLKSSGDDFHLVRAI